MPRSRPSRDPAQGRRVLIVEDDPRIVEALQEDLPPAGYAVVAAVSKGEDALAQKELCCPDIALLDLDLSDAIDGITVGEEMAKDGVAVIYMTADIIRAVQEGRSSATDFLEKPFTWQALLVALDRASQSRKQHMLKALASTGTRHAGRR